jgi:hypothetical protein
VPIIPTFFPMKVKPNQMVRDSPIFRF